MWQKCYIYDDLVVFNPLLCYGNEMGKPTALQSCHHPILVSCKAHNDDVSDALFSVLKDLHNVNN